MKQIKYLIIFAFLSISSQAQDVFDPSQKEALNKAIDERIMKNPEILLASLKNLEETKNKEQMERAKAYIVKHDKKIMKNDNDYIYGNPEGKVSMVVFMDPFCMHCRSFHKTLDDVLKTAKPDAKSLLNNLRIVIKLIPIFGASSEVGVRGILAAKKQSKYLEFQNSMFDQDGELTAEDAIKVATSLKLDVVQFKKDLNSDDTKKIVDDNLSLAKDLGINGTPTTIINNMLIPGEIEPDTLKGLMAQSSKS